MKRPIIVGDMVVRMRAVRELRLSVYYSRTRLHVCLHVRRSPLFGVPRVPGVPMGSGVP